MEIVLGTFASLVILSGIAGIKIDREYERGVIFRLGRFKGIKGPGIYWIIPFAERKAQVDIRTKTVDIAPQEAVTADSVTIRVNAVLFYRILNPNKAINRVENYQMAVYQAAMTTLRNVLGHFIDNFLDFKVNLVPFLQYIIEDVLTDHIT